ncbi:unnamed protein product [Brassica oleracea var. botrytis]
MISLARDLNWSPRLTDFPEILIPRHRKVYNYRRDANVIGANL